jgi:hypothetical protein
MEIETWKQNLLLFGERESRHTSHLCVCAEGIDGSRIRSCGERMIEKCVENA